MTDEPMINYSERAPLLLVAILTAMFVMTMYGPESLVWFIESWCVLVPLSTPGVTMTRQAVSLVGHGFLHANWGHLLMNSGMILVFSVMTLRGLRAYEGSQKPVLRYWLIFLTGVMLGGLCQWGWWAAADIVRAAAIGASGGASTLFAAAAWAIGGRRTMVQYGLAWVLINVILVLAEPILGMSLAWPAHLGGYLMGMILAPLWMKPESSGFSITR